MTCNAIDKAWIGRREYWMRCCLARMHHGAHRDGKRLHYWHETFYRGEFIEGRVKIPTKRKVRLCSKCGKQQRTDGANDACVCKVIGANKRQGIMFAEDRENSERNASLRDLEEDIAWLMSEWAKLDEDGYHGEF